MHVVVVQLDLIIAEIIDGIPYEKSLKIENPFVDHAHDISFPQLASTIGIHLLCISYELCYI